MQDPEAGPELKQLVGEASRALARLDTPRLEELAFSCQVLTRSIDLNDAEERRRVAHQAREAQADMAVFARVIEATRANLNVMKRLRELRAGRLEYSERQARNGGARPPSAGPGRWGEGAEGGHGNN